MTEGIVYVAYGDKAVRQAASLAKDFPVAVISNQIEGHDEQMRRKGIVVEVDYNTAARWNVIGLGPEDIDVAVIEWDTLRGWR